MSWLWVFLGGGLGSICRFGLARWALQHAYNLAWATLAANLMASILLGWLIAQSMQHAALGSLSEGGGVMAFRQNLWSDPTLMLLLGTGFCGGFSTFSTFSLELLQFLQSGRHGLAVAYALSSLALGLAGAAFGFWLASR